MSSSSRMPTHPARTLSLPALNASESAEPTAATRLRDLSPTPAESLTRTVNIIAATESSSVEAKATEKTPRKKHCLLSYDEIPEWYRENEHIRYGYRPVSGSVRTSFSSWKYLHNETVNIYSHLIPALVFVLGLWYISQYLHAHYSRVTTSDELIFAFFLLTATVCLGFSSTYHTLMNHSFALESVWLRLDFVGIVLLTLGDFVSGIYMVFWCEPLLREIYWAMVSHISSLIVNRFISTNTDMSDSDIRSPDDVCHGESQVPRSSLAYLSNIMLHWHWHFWYCATCAWYLFVRLDTDAQTIGDAVLPY